MYIRYIYISNGKIYTIGRKSKAKKCRSTVVNNCIGTGTYRGRENKNHCGGGGEWFLELNIKPFPRFKLAAGWCRPVTVEGTSTAIN
jgi:hypothetical protein